MHPLHLLFLISFIFGLQIEIHADEINGEPSKTVSISTKFIAYPSESEMFPIPKMKSILGTEVLFTIPQKMGIPQEKRPEGVDKKIEDGIRTRFKVLETTDGFLIQGYVFVGMHDPEKLDQEVESLGLFVDQPTKSDQNITDDWVKKIQLSGTFRIRGKAYASLSTPEGNFWVEEGKFASGFKLIKLDLSKSQPSALIRKGEKEGWVGLRHGSSFNQMDMTRSFKDRGLLFIKEVQPGEKFSLPIPMEAPNGEKFSLPMAVAPPNGEKLTLELVATLNE